MLPHSPLIPTKFLVISIHAPARGATGCGFLVKVEIIFQSTLPRGERRYDGKLNDLSASISIHAPTRGATKITLFFMYIFFISIHAPTRGATTITDVSESLTEISIHAPTRGATPNKINQLNCKTISIHAPTRGATATLTNFFFYNQSIFC